MARKMPARRRWSKYPKRSFPRVRRPLAIAGRSWGSARSPFLTGTTIRKRAALNCIALLGPSGYVYPDAISGLAGSNYFNLAQLYAASVLAIRIQSGNIYKEYRLRSFTVRFTPIYVTESDLTAAGADYGQSFIAYSYQGQSVSNAGSNLAVAQVLEYDTAKQFSIYSDHSWTTRVTGSAGGLADWDSVQGISTSSPSAQWGSIALGVDFTGAPSLTPVPVGKFTFTWEVELRTPVM